MTEKRLIVDEDYNIIDTKTDEWLDIDELFDLVNKLDEGRRIDTMCYNILLDKYDKVKEENKELLSYINTLGLGIQKILHNISDGRDAQAMIVCVELLKKLEEEELIGI